ncbi:hypothetical protein AB3A53_000206 [Vibrio vulnificus]|nr:hypothetical protein [Vibrio vulnificus]EJO9866294.1 hypothetical protein [Vibrio vulnificus]
MQPPEALFTKAQGEFFALADGFFVTKNAAQKADEFADGLCFVEGLRRAKTH